MLHPNQSTLFIGFLGLGGLAICLLQEPVLGEGIRVQLPSDMALSPNGATIAFRWANEIWSVPVAGGKATRLTSHPAQDGQPKFSPDGKRIAFISDRSGSDQIWVMSSEGGLPEQKTFHSEGYLLADWFPDGQSVLAIGQRDHFWRSSQRMLQVRIDRRAADRVLLDDAAANPVLSPDGSKILFVREGERWWRKGYRGERAGQIWLMDLTAGSTRELLHEGFESQWPLWMPNGNGFYFVKGNEKGFDLWRYRFAKNQSKGGKQTKLAGFPEDSIVKPAIARDGSVIVFRHLFDLYSYRPGSGLPPEKIVIEIDTDTGMEEDRMQTALTRADQVAFTDDGLEVAFCAGGDLWLMDTELREPIRVTRTDGAERDPIFAPDGKSLWFTREGKGQVDLWKVEPKEPEKFWWQQKEFVETQITSTTQTESDLRFTNDGKHLLYQKGRGDLMIMEVASKTETLLVDGFVELDYSLSPDNRWIAYAASDSDFNSEIWLMPIDRSQPPTNVSRHPDNDRSPVFSPDGKVLAFTGRRVSEETDVYYVYLQEEFDEKSPRDLKLEKAIEAMKKRKSVDSRNSGEKKEANPDSPTETKNSSQRTEGKALEDSEGKKAPKEKEESSKPLRVDLNKIHERVRRINIPDTSEGNLLFSPDSKKLAFSASIDGKSGWYSVEFPDKLQPKFMSSVVASQARWSKSANGILGVTRGIPVKLEGGEKPTEYPFQTRHERTKSGRLQEGFNSAWRLMHEIWYDPAMGGKNWDAIRRKYEEAAGRAQDERGLAEIIELMLGELNGSHLGFTPGSADPDAEPTSSGRAFQTTAHLGVRFDASHPGPGLRVRDILPNGPADREISKIFPNDIVMQIDGTKVDPSLDLSEVLNGDLNRDIVLTIERKEGEATQERKVVMRPINYFRARTLLYDLWLEQNRKKVEEQSAGILGYLHIKAMDMSSFYEFERQLYNVGYGKSGLVIDVRDNGGGSTTDHLLTALTQPRHAITVPRGGAVGYPQDRMVYATWSKPIVVLCNQNSYSNAEIFSHAIKALKRGKLVGVQTAGGVVSTGVARVTDVGVLRAPFRGWFSIQTGQDMELQGALPDVVIWPKPGELANGIDRQLEEGVKILLEEVQALPALPNPRYATERQNTEK